MDMYEFEVGQEVLNVDDESDAYGIKGFVEQMPEDDLDYYLVYFPFHGHKKRLVRGNDLIAINDEE